MHETIMGTRMRSKKISCILRGSTYRWLRLIVENAKIFQSYVKSFWIFPREGRNFGILIGLCK